MLLLQWHDPEPSSIEVRSKAPGAVARRLEAVLDEWVSLCVSAVFVPGNVGAGEFSCHKGCSHRGET